ncbi:alkaline shock response membrane anchor protein AmaP [Frankia sp. Mgl5]|uniref:alkaline shock response membrane anchor protein AmaP n=1 Tax=Frankia sp. Mgl5 TaxID=2933793 RepID=UPI00200FBBAF|nr:alkaline shock response membrane anchor protein AmaP [Frankia sp. Mgl5]MCK9930130.1 alkaline shock response membrane anchor protein AmaP [Frankia sp. Mgl5]
MTRGGVPARHAAPSAGAGSPAPTRAFIPVVDRCNQVLLVLVGLVLLSGGVLVLLAGSGLFGPALADRPVLGGDVRSFAARHGWFWPVVGTAAGVVALCAVGWLVAQARTSRLRGLYVTDDEVGGVHLDTAALADAVAADLVANPVVHAVRVVVRGRPRPPVLQLAVEADAGADIRAVRSDVEERVLPRARRAVGRPDLGAEIDLAVHAGPPARVR